MHHRSRIFIDPLDEVLAALPQALQGLMAVIPRHFLPYPFPQSFDRVQIRAVTWQWLQRQVHRWRPKLIEKIRDSRIKGFLACSSEQVAIAEEVGDAVVPIILNIAI